MTRHVISSLEDFPPNTRRVVDIDGTAVAVFNVEGKFHALRDACPHKGASLCTDPPTGTMLPSEPGEYNYGQEAQVVRCPWHGFEYNLSDGRSVVAPEIKSRVRVFDIDVEDEKVVIYT